MAKKIVLAFTGQPAIGDTFGYGITLNGVSLVYTSGLLNADVEYVAKGTIGMTATNVEIQTTLNATINNTLSFLQANHSSSVIEYERVNDAIEVSVDSLDTIVITPAEDSLVITITVVDIESSIEIADTPPTLRYFFRYTNIVNDSYLCKIYKKNNTEQPTEISGTAIIDKGSVKDHLDPIRGTGLSLELEASTLLTLEDLYTQDEQDFIVKLYKNTNLIFHGFLKPDGVYQSFVNDVWMLSLDCVDGLGALSNLSFVQDTGLHFVGKMKAIDIIYYCLKRTGISLPINTSINILYDGLTASDSLDILTKIKLNSDRFVKTDNDTIMSCEEVLKSVLDIFSACITQENGEWYIYKANEIYNTPNVLFRRYDIDNVYTSNVTIDLNEVLGSQIDLFYPHHCNSDQRIEIKGGISAFRLGYKYGFVEGLLQNASLKHDVSLNYSGWTKDPSADSFLVNNPLFTSGVYLKSLDLGSTNQLILTSSPVAIKLGDVFDFKASLTTYGFNTTFKFKIRIGAYYLLSNSEWTTTDSFFEFVVGSSAEDAKNYPEVSDTLSVSSRPSPLDGTLYIDIYRPVNRLPPFAVSLRPMVLIRSVDITTSASDFSAKKGEFHTVSRKTKVSSIVKENKTVFNGDKSENFYLGTIFKEDGIEYTGTWFRKNIFESKPILRIAAEEELRILQKPLKVFKGSIYGYIPYLSLIDINNVEGKFMPIEYSYDTKANITKAKLMELYSPEISNIKYKFTFDYGNTVKPTISG